MCEPLVLPVEHIVLAIFFKHVWALLWDPEVLGLLKLQARFEILVYMICIMCVCVCMCVCVYHKLVPKFWGACTIYML